MGLSIKGSESGFCHIDGAIETVNSGYSGNDYLNPDDLSGARIVWHVIVPQTGLYNIEITYANGDDVPHSGNLLVNENNFSPTIYNFDPSGGWDQWQLAMATVRFPGGSNRIDLIAADARGLANIDSIRIEGHLSAGDCSVYLSEGAQLWRDLCGICHNKINGDSVGELRNAINRVRAMNHLQYLSDQQLQAIVDSL